jgi:predicted ribosomally synthesized peptide with SipW-like signal peptide
MKKKIITLCLIVAMIAVAAIGGTLAYFTDSKTTTNTFTMGSVEIELTESSWSAPANTVPGVSYAKNPVVKNTGMNDAWIRVDVILSDATAFKTAAAKYTNTELSSMFVGLDTTNWTTLTSADGANDTLIFSFYYKTALAKETSTSALFTAVKIPGKFTNADMTNIGTDFTITVQAHAIQTSDDYATVEDAFAKYVE